MNLKVEYFGEMAWGNESGDQVGSIHEKLKKQRSKISWDDPFKSIYPSKEAREM